MPPCSPRARACAASRCERNAVDARWFTESLKEGSRDFFADDRDLTGCRYYSSGIVVGPPDSFIGSPLLSAGADRFSLSHAHARARASASAHTPTVRSDPPIRSYIYCIEETRAAAFLAHAPPVMSGLQSCLSFRPSVRRTGRLPCPLLGPPRLLPRARPFSWRSWPLFFARCSISRLCRPGQIRPHLDTHAPRGAPFAPFLRDSFNDRHDRSPLILVRNRA